MAVELLDATNENHRGPTVITRVYDPRARAAELLSRFSYAESFRKQYDEKAVKFYKAYVGHRDKPKIEGRSNLHIPRTYEIVDAIRARIVRSFFANRPYLDFLPLPRQGGTVEELLLRAEKAKIAAALVDEQLDRNQIVKKFYDFVTSVCVFPAGIMSVGWRFDQRLVKRKVEVPVYQLDAFGNPMLDEAGQPIIERVETQIVEVPYTVWDDNEIKNVDFFDFWPDPRGQDIDSCRFVFQREWLNEEQIQDKLAVLHEAGIGTVFPLNWEEVRSTGAPEEGRYERLTAVGITPETSEGFWSPDDERGLRKGKLYEVLHYWEDDRHAILINRKFLAYEGDNPYWRHQKKPFVVASFEPLPNEFYGMSVVQIIYHLQEELNTARNQRIDAVSMVLNRMWKVRRSADIDESELVSRNHGIIHVDDPDDVTWFEFSEIPHSSYTDEQIIKIDMENAVGTPSIVRGVDPVRQETATEIVTKSSNAGIRFDVKIMLFEALGIKRLAMLMDLNNQQFIDTERLVRVFGEEAGFQWVTVAPHELVGEWDYRPSGANVDPGANKELRREQLNQVMAAVLASGNPYIDKYELTKMWLESYDIRNVEKLLLPREVVEQQMALQQQQQMLQELLVAGRHQGNGRSRIPEPPPTTGLPGGV